MQSIILAYALHPNQLYDKIWEKERVFCGRGRNASVNERASVVIELGTLVHTRVSALLDLKFEWHHRQGLAVLHLIEESGVAEELSDVGRKG